MSPKILLSIVLFINSAMLQTTHVKASPPNKLSAADESFVVPCGNVPIWNASTPYVGGTEVSYKGVKYKAKWWTLGFDPSTVVSQPWDTPWQKVGPCDGQTNPLNASISQTRQISCANSADGSIRLQITGGIKPYTLLWNTGAKDSLLANQPSGNYSVSITDAVGATISRQITLQQPAPLTISSSKTDASLGANGSISISIAGGTSPYRFLWNTGATTKDLSGLAPGTYTLTVTDANNCTQQQNIIISSVANALKVTLTVAKEISCNGGSDGSLTSSVTGGTAPYTYLWNTGATAATLSGVSAGMYTLTVKDAKAQQASQQIAIQQPTSIAISYSSTNETPASKGSIDASIQGGTSPYTYQWSNGATTQDLTNLSAGDYTLIVKDSRNCTAQIVIKIILENGTGVCNTPAYDPAKAYPGGSEVLFEGRVYKAKWYANPGQKPIPGSTSSDTPWQDAGPCAIDGNKWPEIKLISPINAVTRKTLSSVMIVISAQDYDGTIQKVVCRINGQVLTATLSSGTNYNVSWLPPSFGTFPFTIEGTDNKNKTVVVNATLSIVQSSETFVISKEEYESIFPYRFGYDPNTGVFDPTKDFFSFENFKEAYNRMKNINVIMERRRESNLYRITRIDKTTGQQKVVHVDAAFNDPFYVNRPIISETIDFADFCNYGSIEIQRRELAAFLANISQETTGGWPTAPGGQYAWGLHFREEVGGETSGYRDELNQNYPPAPGKSYHGRGPIQLSWNYNYGQASEILFGDKNVLLQNPEKVIQDGALSFQTAIWFWMTPQSPKPSCHAVMTGKWIPTCFDTQRGRTPGFGTTVNIINGGLECGSGTENTKVINRIGHYKRHSGILGSSLDINGENTCSSCGCASQVRFGPFEGEADQCKPSPFFINVYPNKVTGSTLTLQHDNLTSSFTSLALHNEFGNMVWSHPAITKNSNTSEWTLALPDQLPNGLYILHIRTSQGTTMQRVLIQRE